LDVNLNDLPANIKTQIPISLRINKQTLVYEDLPVELQFIVQPYTTLNYQRPTTNLVIDYRADLGIYGDWDEMTSLTATILEYIKNWFSTPFGSYPYDNNFGSRLKRVLMTKDTALQDQLLKNEINTIHGLVNDLYPSSFSVQSSSVVPIEFGDHTEYRLNMEIKVLGQAKSINVTQ